MNQWLWACALMAAPGAFAQDGDPPAEAPTPEASAEVDAEVDAEAEDWAAAIELPMRAKQLRDLGVSSDDVRGALGAAKERGVTGKATVVMMDEGRRAIEEHGPVDNFGAFVQERLDEGLRGRELADAIKREHQASGKGPSAGRGGGPATIGGPGGTTTRTPSKSGKSKRGKAKAKGGKAKGGKAKGGKAKGGKSKGGRR